MPDTTDQFIDEIHAPAVDNPNDHRHSLLISRNLSLLLLVVLIALAAIVRIIATHNDLWLDEIISVQIADALHSPWQIFTAVHSGNNHQTNTLYLYFVRHQSAAPVFRYLSVVWGVLLVPAGYWLLSRRSRWEALILAGLLACSYPLIHFSSEARGYAGALFGSVLACAALTRWLAQKDGQGRSFFLGLTYGLGLTIAVLSHVTACLVWFPMALASLVILLGEPKRAKGIALWVALNLLPASVLAGLYLLDPRFLTQLGGPPMTVFQGLARLLANTLGWPARDTATIWIVMIPLMALVAFQLIREYKSSEPLSLILELIYLGPILCVLVLHPAFFSPRYFLVVAPFLYVAIAILLARLVGRTAGGIALGAVLLLFFAGHAYLYAKFLPVGRGDFTEALQYMMAHTPSPRLSVASDQDFRSSIELAYFAPRVLVNRQLVYVPRPGQASSQLDWYILHGEGYEPPGPAELHTPGQPAWYRVAYFGAAELSGQAWTLYTHQPVK